MLGPSYLLLNNQWLSMLLTGSLTAIAGPSLGQLHLFGHVQPGVTLHRTLPSKLHYNLDWCPAITKSCSKPSLWGRLDDTSPHSALIGGTQGKSNSLLGSQESCLTSHSCSAKGSLHGFQPGLQHRNTEGNPEV